MSDRLAERFLAEARARIEAHLDRWLAGADEAPAILHEAMRYATLGGGKRLRAALAFGAAEALEAEPERALPVAAAVELVHAYSLVHDDLPAMDDDDLRRGQPAVHVRFGEAHGILTGDALLAAAFEVLAVDGVPNEVMRGLARAAGSRALVGGQVDDLAFVPREASLERVESIHARKTVALFEFAVGGTARLLAAKDPQRAALERFARSYGHAFQILDDLEDGSRDECSILLALDPSSAVARAAERLGEAERALDPFYERAAGLRALAVALGQRLG